MQNFPLVLSLRFLNMYQPHTTSVDWVQYYPFQLVVVSCCLALVNWFQAAAAGLAVSSVQGDGNCRAMHAQ